MYLCMYLCMYNGVGMIMTIYLYYLHMYYLSEIQYSDQRHNGRISYSVNPVDNIIYLCVCIGNFYIQELKVDTRK